MNQLLGLTAAALALLAFAGKTQAQIIILQDNFAAGSTGGTVWDQYPPGSDAGLAPSTYLPTPASNWQHIAGQPYNQNEFSNVPLSAQYVTGDYVAFKNNDAAGISLGSYNTGTLAVTCDLQYGTQNNQGTPATPSSSSYTLLGFSPAVDLTNTNLTQNINGPTTTYGFTGLEAEYNGALQEWVDGTKIGSAIAFVGIYNPAAATLLSYDINTATGAISAVTFGSSTATYNFGTGTFTNADTAYAELGGDGGGNINAESIVSSLAIEEVPEPSTYVLLGFGCIITVVLRKRLACL